MRAKTCEQLGRNSEGNIWLSSRVERGSLSKPSILCKPSRERTQGRKEDFVCDVQKLKPMKSHLLKTVRDSAHSHTFINYLTTQSSATSSHTATTSSNPNPRTHLQSGESLIPHTTCRCLCAVEANSFLARPSIPRHRMHRNPSRERNMQPSLECRENEKLFVKSAYHRHPRSFSVDGTGLQDSRYSSPQ